MTSITPWLMLLAISTQFVGCTTTQVRSNPDRAISDRYGIMYINLPGHWYDDTDNYVKHVERSRKGNSADPGIKSLLMLKQHDDLAFCTFRTFRYLRNEQGYQWDAKRVAEEAARFKNESLMKNELGDYLRKGVPVTVGQTKAQKVELEDSSVFRLFRHSGWQVLYALWFGRSGLNRELSLTVAIPYSEKTDRNIQKHHLVAECAIHNTGHQLEKKKEAVFRMLNTISIRDESN